MLLKPPKPISKVLSHIFEHIYNVQKLSLLLDRLKGTEWDSEDAIAKALTSFDRSAKRKVNYPLTASAATLLNHYHSSRD